MSDIDGVHPSFTSWHDYALAAARAAGNIPAPCPTCCGDFGHSPKPGIGCTRPGCLCLEPSDVTHAPIR
jgi:hypothetical protein